jgi:hypothetical protein
MMAPDTLSRAKVRQHRPCFLSWRHARGGRQPCFHQRAASWQRSARGIRVCGAPPHPLGRRGTPSPPGTEGTSGAFSTIKPASRLGFGAHPPSGSIRARPHGQNGRNRPSVSCRIRLEQYRLHFGGTEGRLSPPPDRHCFRAGRGLGRGDRLRSRPGYDTRPLGPRCGIGMERDQQRCLPRAGKGHTIGE